MNERIVNQTKCSVSVMPQLLDNAREGHIGLSCCDKLQLMSFLRFPCGKYKYRMIYVGDFHRNFMVS